MHEGTIAVEGLTKNFGAIKAVRELSFTVAPGSVTGFLGPNGAGKTTTLRMLLGLVRPTEGTATIGGRRFDQLGNPARVVGAVLEAQNFHPGRKAWNHLRCYAAAMGVPARRVDEVVELVGLRPAVHRKARGYSQGMKQRLALATALLGDPQVLVLDEPANGLDPEGIAWLRHFLQSFARSGRTVLISSHILAEVEQTVDQVVIVSRGECVYNGHLDDLRAGQRRRVLVESNDPSALVSALQAAGVTSIDLAHDGRLVIPDVDRRQVGDAALAAGVAIYGMAEERTDLEQVFFQLTMGQFTGAPPPGYTYALPPGYYGSAPAPGHQPPGYAHPPGSGPQPPGYAVPSGSGPQPAGYAHPPGAGPQPPGYGPQAPGYAHSPGAGPQLPSYGATPGSGPQPPGYAHSPGAGPQLPGYEATPGSGPQPPGYGDLPQGYGPPPGYEPVSRYAHPPGYEPQPGHPAPPGYEPRPEPEERSPYARPLEDEAGEQR